MNCIDCLDKLFTSLSRVIVLAAFIIIAVLSFSWQFNRLKEPFPQTINVSFAYKDSLNTQKLYSSAEIDSLITIVYEYDRALINRYKYTIEQNEIDSHRNSYLELLITLVGCVLAFFGISSFTDIKNKAKKTAESVAENTAQEIAKTTAQKEARKIAKAVAKETAKVEAYNTATDITKSEWESYKKYKIHDELEVLFKRQFNKVISDTLEASFTDYKQQIDRLIEEMSISSKDNCLAIDKLKETLVEKGIISVMAPLDYPSYESNDGSDRNEDDDPNKLFK